MADLSFELWLEFEHWQPMPDDDLEDDFFNMHIYTSDGKRYALNVWTYKCFQRLIAQARQDGQYLHGKYFFAPDLFIEKLDRALVEAVVKDLIRDRELRAEWLIAEDSD